MFPDGVSCLFAQVYRGFMFCPHFHPFQGLCNFHSRKVKQAFSKGLWGKMTSKQNKIVTDNVLGQFHFAVLVSRCKPNLHEKLIWCGIVGISFQITQKLNFSKSTQFQRTNKDLYCSTYCHSATICRLSYLCHVAPILALHPCGPPWKGKTLRRNETGEDVLDNCGAPLQRQF